jgi:membrane associated rhomboid family serine protease
MFPLRDENPTLQASVATFIIIGLNIASWIFLQGAGFNPALAKSVCTFGLIPGDLLGTVDQGVRVPVGPGLVCVLDGHADWITLFTSMFMHGGWFHLIANMWFLFIFGDNVEDAMGALRFIVFYLLCGLGAVAAQIISNPASAAPMVGASGAIGGVMGGYAILYPRVPVHLLVFFGFFFTRIVVPAYVMLGYWFLLQLISAIPSIEGTRGGVAFWAHIGGFITGVVLIRIFCNTDRLNVCRKKRGSMSRFIQKISNR